ncbi:hypothetical protein PTSG_07547 [Salpingoeca rosetta]|uniref:EF-hand domain-containing protein n=1 Tax=Salpingoeca rosetta (strain ATCC 50818 / BSB-021) TaxID=946362 RepID=F2UH31_SALR5|nr:uncharacterized protein PTSG_07547 [Salpingoeca rosetta]EGD76430.1 hypothetical protein PTSG_07547 [Salpingoeca rosetta]|eukprot:XP_004991345.1 hypothetical protein PTSG_07547 [Salpingoeca rosetta]
MWHTRAARPPWVETPRDRAQDTAKLQVSGRPSTMERRAQSPRKQDYRRKVSQPDSAEGRNPYGEEAVQQEIANLEAQAQLLERAGEAAEKKRDFASAEKHFLEAARLMGEAQGLKRRSFNPSAEETTSYKKRGGRGGRGGAHHAHTQGARGRGWNSHDGADDNERDDEVIRGRRGRGGTGGGGHHQQQRHRDDQDDEDDEYAEEDDDVDQLDYKLNRTLGKTLMSHRDMHTRREIVSADQQLLDVLGWSEAKRERMLSAFRAITSSPHMTFHHFAAFLSTQGVSLKFAVPLFRAFDRRQHGTWLSDGDFLIGIGACARNTPHSGGWLRVRLGFIFRYFSSNGKTMTADQLQTFVDECCAADPRITLRLPNPPGATQRVHMSRSMAAKQTVTPARLVEHLMGGRHAMSQSEFVSLGLNRSLPDCTNVCRFNLGA